MSMWSVCPSDGLCHCTAADRARKSLIMHTRETRPIQAHDDRTFFILNIQIYKLPLNS